MESVKCRLCTGNEDLIEIFSENGRARHLPLKINECLPIVVRPTDHLSKLICLPCINKVEEYYKFWRACEEANHTLDSALKAQKEPNLQFEVSQQPFGRSLSDSSSDTSSLDSDAEDYRKSGELLPPPCNNTGTINDIYSPASKLNEDLQLSESSSDA